MPSTQPSPPASPPKQTEDALFIVPPPPEPEPLSKGKLAFIIGLTVFGVLVIITGVLLSLSAAAKQAAYDYNRAAGADLTKTDTALKELRPSAVLNRRDVMSPRKEVKKIQQSQANLSEILLGSTLSSDYKHSAQLFLNINQYYQDLLSFMNDMDDLVAFSDGVQAIISQEARLAKLLNPNNSISLRSASGSTSGDAKQIDNLKISPELAVIKQKIIKAINKKSKAYKSWAAALEKHKPGGAKTAKRHIAEANKAIRAAANDSEYVKAFGDRYGSLQKQQADLKRQAAL